MVYHAEAGLGSCPWRGYVPEGEAYALGSLFIHTDYLAADAEHH